MFVHRSVVMLVLFCPIPAGGALGFSSDVFIMDAVGGGDMNLGELADLTVANDNDLSMDVITYLFWDYEWDIIQSILAQNVYIDSFCMCVRTDAGQQRGVQEDVEPSFYTSQPL